jgi:hypothetical protein
MAKITDKEIRKYLGHNGVECSVKIGRDGRVERYGSPTVTDRSMDFWAYMGTKADVVKQIESERA